MPNFQLLVENIEQIIKTNHRDPTYFRCNTSNLNAKAEYLRLEKKTQKKNDQHSRILSC